MRFLILVILLASCQTIPKGSFIAHENKGTPDYGNLNNWAAAPQKEDPADRTPGNVFINNQDQADADVFFLHPTSYTKRRGNNEWNATLEDDVTNQRTDKGAIQFQASVFNGAAKVYAPRYRQAHVYVYYTKEGKPERKYAEKALDLAYNDVKEAFEYYLKHWNKGRPIIIASHSQGTTHAIRLLQEYFDGQELMKQFVAGYLIGMPVKESDFKNILPCENSNDTGCIMSWRSYKKGYLPKWHESGSDIIVTNPLIWSRDTTYVSANENKGTVLFNFDKGIKPGITDAQIHEDHLWINKPKFRGSFFVRIKNYHAADYNLFYANIRENVLERVYSFLKTEDK